MDAIGGEDVVTIGEETLGDQLTHQRRQRHDMGAVVFGARAPEWSSVARSSDNSDRLIPADFLTAAAGQQ